MSYDLDKFKGSIPARAQQYAEVLIQSTAGIPSDLITPFLMCGILMRESGAGEFLTPAGPNGTGDSGHGRGLVQIDDRSFGSWLANNNWMDPLTNITFGANLLNTNLEFFSKQAGSVINIGPQTASARGVVPGAYADPRPILNQNLLLSAFIAAYNTGCGNSLWSLAVGVSPDITTTCGNYSKDVINRMNGFLAAYNNS